jgi:tRNA 2-selenouridine synthase
MVISPDEFLVLRKNLPLIDVRSEGEFERGHIPGAVNIPLLTNEERAAVGTDYKTSGQAEAIKTGFRLVGPRLVDIIHDTERIAEEKEIIVHCWRGGMRSDFFCRFVQMAGIKTHQLKGGYKSYRKLVHQSFHQPFQFMVIGGYTGSGKTEILQVLAKAGEQVIDLEQLANHKGSVFGGLMMSQQPTTEQFENNLFEVINTLDVNKRIWIEDESIAIGKIFLPLTFWKTLCTSPVIEIEMEKANRVGRLVNEYSKSNPAEFLNAMSGIIKKLGGQHYKAAKEKLLADDWSAAIDSILTYYDKAYHNSLNRKHKRIVNRISWDGKNIDQLIQRMLNFPNKSVIN